VDEQEQNLRQLVFFMVEFIPRRSYSSASNIPVSPLLAYSSARQPPLSFLSSLRAVDALLITIVLAFLAQAVLPNFTEVFWFNPQHLQWWMPISSIFLHGGLMHLFLNCYALFAFGPILEHRIGRARFLALFFLGGLAGSLGYELVVLAGLSAPIPALGASGAIYAVMGAMAVLYPNIVVLLFGIIPLSMRWAAVLWVVLESIGTFGMSSSGIASAAHLGGLFLGFAWGKWEAERAKTQAHRYGR